MKKLFLTLALGVSLCANAQLTVLESGQVCIGNSSIYSSQANLIVGEESHSSNPAYFGPITGRISLGCNDEVSISGGTLGILNLTSTSSIAFKLGENKVFSITDMPNLTTSTYSIKAPSFLTSSDVRLKKNVTTLTDSFEKLKDVNAVSYNFKTSTTQNSPAKTTKDSGSLSGLEDDRTHFGFIAQEIQKIYPNLVVEDEEGMLAIDYIGFIPLLVEAYKELSNSHKDLTSKIQEQEELIDALLAQKGPSYMPASVNSLLAESKASLKQNKPNPFNSTTTIECSVPQSVASAFICVYDLQGKQVHRIDIRDRGDVANVIDASYFTPGMYIYALITDGVEIDSKRMIITD